MVRKKIKIVFKFIILLFLTLLFSNCVFQLPKIEYNLGTIEYKLEEARYKFNLPAICCLISKGENQTIFAAVGYRSSCNLFNKVTINDKWHIGSITKPMTATLVAKIIEENPNINWDTTIIDIFPEFENIIQTEYYDIKFTDLLTHTAGIISDIRNVPGWNDYYTDSSPIIEQRYKLTKEILKIKPEAPKGVFLYSNAGYVVVGAMIEKIMGLSWEELLKKYILEPFSMNDTGVGAPKPSCQQPCGHIQDGTYLIFKPIYPENLYSDNPKVLGPVGTLHTTMQDILKFSKIHLDGLKGISTFLSQDSFNRLYHVVDYSYACGWYVLGKTLIHYGSNTYWFAYIYISYDEVSNESIILFIAMNACFSNFNFNYTFISGLHDIILND